MAAAGQRVVVALGAGVGALFAAVVTAGVQARMASQPAIPLDPAIPNERLLIARGLAGVPSRGQATYPIAVDRVVTDCAATYMAVRPPTTVARPDEARIPRL